MMPTHKALFGRYQDSTVIQKSTQFAQWTLPQLMAVITDIGTTQRIERDYQSHGALLVNNLGSKLAGLLFPSSRPFYKIKPSAELQEQARKKGAKDNTLSAALAKLEMSSCQQLFLNASYEQLVMALKHLIVTGNVLLFRDSKAAKTTAYGVQSFGILRDGRGNMVDCVLREYTQFDSLAPDIRAVLQIKNAGRYNRPDGSSARVELYTRIKRAWQGDAIVYEVSQQADDVDVGKPGVYPEHLCPWQAPCWSLVAGENYGRGLVEDFAGGFAKLSDLSLALTLYQIAVSKVVNLVSPGQGADVDELQDAETGDYVQGSKESVSPYEMGDGNKMREMREAIEAEFGQLARAFMYKANTRNAERVTAFELKQDAMEAETTLGGVYSSLSASMQIPLAHVLLTEVEPGTLEGIIDKSLKLDIMAGIPALGRAADVQNIAQAATDAAAIMTVLPKLDRRIDTERLLDIIYAGQSIDTSTIFMDEDQMAKQQQAAQQQQQGQEQIAQASQMAEQAQQYEQQITQ